MVRPGVDRAELLAKLFGDDVPDPLNAEVFRTREVAVAFRVSERTIVEWARRGRIPSIRTPGGQRLYPAGPIMELLHAMEGEPAAETPDH